MAERETANNKLNAVLWHLQNTFNTLLLKQ